MRGEVLIVDDNALDIKVITRALESLGFSCNGFTDYRAALAWADQNEARLIFLDLQMPLVSGYDLVPIFKAKPLQSSATIIIVSGRNGIEDVKKAVSVGASDYIIKPVDPLVLQDKVKKLDENTTETEFNQTSLDSSDGAAYLSRPLSIVELSEFGCRAVGGEKIPPNSTFDLTGLSEEIFGESKIVVRSLSSEMIRADTYSSQFTFVGLSEARRKHIRLACRKLWIKSKEAS